MFPVLTHDSCHGSAAPFYRPGFVAPPSRSPAADKAARTAGAIDAIGRNSIGSEVRTLLAATSRLDRSVKKATVALVRKLIATRFLFSLNGNDLAPQRLRFNLREPVRRFNISRAGMAHLLHDISPSLAEDETLVGSLSNLVNHDRGARQAGKDARGVAMPIPADRAPCDWPRETLLQVLGIGQWDSVDLSGIDLSNTDLRGVKWSGANLREAVLRGSDLSKGDLSQSDLTGSDLRYCDFTGANLYKANMESATADGAVLRNADLTLLGAKNAFFLKADFLGAITSGANFAEAHLEYATGLRFDQGALFTDAELNHVEAGWDLKENPFLSKQSAAVRRQLQSLGSIHPRHDQLHNTIVYRLLEAICAEHGKPGEHPLLADLLLQQTRCWPDERLRGFIDNILLPPLLGQWNTRTADSNEPPFAQVMRYLTETRPALDWPNYCGAVSQLQRDAASNFPDRVHALSALLKSHPAIAPLALAVDGAGLEPFDECSIFMAANQESAIVYPNSTLQELAEGSGSPYNGYYFVRDGADAFTLDVLRDLDTIESCGVPLALYNVAPPSLAAIDLLSYIFEGSGLAEKFIHALTCKSHPPRSMDGAAIAKLLEADLHLSRHFDKFLGLTTDRLGDDIHINALRCQRLWEKFSAVESAIENSDANLARMLLCLGTLFVRYSSSALFGTELESLNSLRNFAWACLHSAHMLDASLLGKEQIISVRDTLRGKQNHLQCTNTLTERLLEIIAGKMGGDAGLATCFRAIYPQSGM